MLWKIRKSGAGKLERGHGKGASLRGGACSVRRKPAPTGIHGGTEYSESTRAADFLAFVLGGLKEKQDLHVGVPGWKETPFRFAYGLINNFQYLPSLGPLGRAWLWGLLPDGRQVAWELVGQAFLAGLAVLALAGTFAMTAVSIARPASGLASASAFVLGAAAFSAYLQSKRPGALVSVHDADRFPGGTAQIDFGLIAWFLLYGCRHCWWSTCGAMGSPRRRSNCSSASRKFSPGPRARGTVCRFCGLPRGAQDSSLFDLRGIERFPLDLVQLYDAKGSTTKLYELLDRRVDAAHARGGRVLVFRALDPYDWRGPVMHVTLKRSSPRRFAVAPGTALQASWTNGRRGLPEPGKSCLANTITRRGCVASKSRLVRNISGTPMTSKSRPG